MDKDQINFNSLPIEIVDLISQQLSPEDINNLSKVNSISREAVKGGVVKIRNQMSFFKSGTFEKNKLKLNEIDINNFDNFYYQLDYSIYLKVVEGEVFFEFINTKYEIGKINFAIHMKNLIDQKIKITSIKNKDDIKLKKLKIFYYRELEFGDSYVFYIINNNELNNIEIVPNGSTYKINFFNYDFTLNIRGIIIYNDKVFLDNKIFSRYDSILNASGLAEDPLSTYKNFQFYGNNFNSHYGKFQFSIDRENIVSNYIIYKGEHKILYFNMRYNKIIYEYKLLSLTEEQNKMLETYNYPTIENFEELDKLHDFIKENIDLPTYFEIKI